MIPLNFTAIVSRFARMRRGNSLLSIALIAAITPFAAAQHHGDVFVAVESDQITTGLIDENEIVELNVRTFEAEFGESGLPEFTDEPGFEAFPGTFAPDQRVGWNATHGLRRWNGNGFDEAIDETLTVSFGPLNFEIGSTPVNGFDLAVQPDGGLHRHLGFLLDHSTSDPAVGVYLVELEMYALDADPSTSEPFWLVLNYLATEEEHEAAAMWVEENLEGESPCLGDLDGDHDVDTDDLLTMLANWGTCEGCASDIDQNGAVDVTDLLQLLAHWGDCH